MSMAMNDVSFTTASGVNFSKIAATFLLSPTLLMAGCSSSTPSETSIPQPLLPVTAVQLSSPAAENYASEGGTPALAYQLSGEAVKICRLTNGKQCEERVMMKGICS